MRTSVVIAGALVFVVACSGSSATGPLGGGYMNEDDGTGSGSGGAGTGAGDDAGSGGAADDADPGGDAGAGGGDDAGGGGGDGGGGAGDGGGGGGGIGLGGASKCAGAAFALCDGFEAALDPAVWSKIANNATVTLDATHAARGAKALHVHTGVSGSDTAGTNGGVRTTHGFPFANDDLWGRVFVWMANASPDAHTNLIEAVGQLPGGATSHYRLGVTTNHVLSGNYIPGDYADRSTMQMPLDKWTCFEWHYDGAHDEYHVFANGNEIQDMAILSGHTPAWTAPQFAYLEVGLHLYHDLPNEPVLDVWYDELALSSTRVGCKN